MQNLVSIKIPFTYSLLRDYSTVIYRTMIKARDRNCVKEKEDSRVMEPRYFAAEIECVTFA